VLDIQCGNCIKHDTRLGNTIVAVYRLIYTLIEQSAVSHLAYWESVIKVSYGIYKIYVLQKNRIKILAAMHTKTEIEPILRVKIHRFSLVACNPSFCNLEL